jgi:threonine/homoserine/homoserine lactone efflux protein
MDMLPALPTLLLFLGASVTLLLTPGPVVLYIITRSVDQGRPAGLASALAGSTGNLVHVLAAAFGLSAILSTSAVAFNIVKYVGAAYLVYIGLRTLLTAQAAQAVTVRRQPLRHIYQQGLMVAIFNPKTALFFLAFFPQFIDQAHGPEVARAQILLLGCLYVLIGTFTDSLYALAAGTAGAWLRGNRWFQGFQRYVAGTIYISLGLTAAFAPSSAQK